mmetsp:Transcript_2473/g.3351  ORF Transcript_2473/g.3351 Transcript_2473/m.3351 type:complete len:457 (+) Transcript_2473:110-1480(+)
MSGFEAEKKEKPADATESSDATATQVVEKLAAMDVSEKEKVINALLGGRNAMAAQAKANQEKKEHKFWKTQPVKQQETADDKGAVKETESGSLGPLEEKTLDQVRKEPYPLPRGFHWVSVNIGDPTEADEVYNLLTENYVEDDDNLFRFDYSVNFLQWALQPPGYFKDWIVGVRQTSNGKLRGFITGIPAKVRVHDTMVEMAEINFLCVHKKLRSKRLAPVLIKEITRRVNLRNMWQAVYTAGVVIPTPMAKCRYWHRTINPKKLIAVGFSSLGPRMTMARTIRLYKLPAQTQIPGFRKMELKDAAAVAKMLKGYLSQFNIWIEFDESEVKHWLFTRDGVVNSFVVENPETKEVTDFCSFYHIPSTVIGNDTYKAVNAAYSYYNVAKSVPLKDLMHDALISAANIGCDVFNCLDVMENKTFIDELKFGKGDGNLQYYFYNYSCPTMDPENVGIVLL